jgi:hypothetical protein
MYRTTIAIATALTLVSMPVKADDEGCTVILCLSNPAGWSAVAECVPPVQRALKTIAKGRFPSCSYASGTLDGAKARVGASVMLCCQVGASPTHRRSRPM